MLVTVNENNHTIYAEEKQTVFGFVGLLEFVGFAEFVEIGGDSLRLIEINGDRWKLAGRWRLESPHSNQGPAEPRYSKIFTVFEVMVASGAGYTRS
jgi:hypothetical protein